MTDMTEDEYYGVAYRSSRTDVYYARDPDLKCTWRQWNIVGPHAVAVFVDDGHCTDMTGAIRVATRLFPGVTEITVISGEALDIVYRQTGAGWEAQDLRGKGRVVGIDRDGLRIVLTPRHDAAEERGPMSEARRRPTDEEIRAKIAMHQTAVDDEEANGGQGSEDWLLARTVIRELTWVLGE